MKFLHRVRNPVSVGVAAKIVMLSFERNPVSWGMFLASVGLQFLIFYIFTVSLRNMPEKFLTLLYPMYIENQCKNNCQWGKK
jgi:hypothetical protein